MLCLKILVFFGLYLTSNWLVRGREVLTRMQALERKFHSVTYDDWKQNGMKKTFIVKVVPGKYKNLTKIEAYVTGKLQIFQNHLKSRNIQSLVIFTYLKVFQGFSIFIDYLDTAEEIENLDFAFIETIYEENRICYLNQGDSEAGRGVKLQQMLDARSFRSAGVKIAIIDQGIRFRDAPFVVPGKTCQELGDEGCRVKFIEDFVGIDYAEYNGRRKYMKRPGALSLEPYGDHGTAMASLSGGTDPAAPGIAQEADFLDYRVLGPKGNSQLFVILAAFDLAVIDKADVICMSLSAYSTDGGIGIDPQTAFMSGENDILISSSVGNKPSNIGLFRTNDLLLMQRFLAVGSFDPSIQTMYYVQLNVKKNSVVHILKRFVVRGVSKVHELDGLLNQLALEACFVTRSAGNVQWICPENTPMKQKIAIIQCFNADDCQQSLAHIRPLQPRAVLFAYSTRLDARIFAGETIPMGQVRRYVSKFLKDLVPMRPNTILFEREFQETNYRNLIPGKFTSTGPSVHLEMVPHVSFVGRIMAYTGNENSKYTTQTGTSNANALAAGAWALFVGKCLSENRPVTYAEIKQRAMNTATPFLYGKFQETHNSWLEGLAHPVLHQGAGLMDIQALLNTKVLLEPPSLELKHVKPGQQLPEQRIKIINQGDLDITYQIEHVPANGVVINIVHDAFGYYSSSLDISCHAPDGRLNKVTVHARSEVELRVEISGYQKNAPRTFINGYLKFFPTYREAQPDALLSQLKAKGYTTLSLPYLFYYGNYQIYPTIVFLGRKNAFLTDATVANYATQPLEAARGYPRYAEVTSFPTYTLQGTSRPVISLCTRFRLSTLSFQLYRYLQDHGQSQSLGTIRKALLVEAQQCYLFLLTKQRIKWGTAEGLTDRRDLGWDGFYFSPSLGKVVRVETGTYVICAVTRKIGDPHLGIEANTAWCSVSFNIDLRERKTGNGVGCWGFFCT